MAPTLASLVVARGEPVGFAPSFPFRPAVSDGSAGTPVPSSPTHRICPSFNGLRTTDPSNDVSLAVSPPPPNTVIEPDSSRVRHASRSSPTSRVVRSTRFVPEVHPAHQPQQPVRLRVAARRTHLARHPPRQRRHRRLDVQTRRPRTRALPAGRARVAPHRHPDRAQRRLRRRPLPAHVAHPFAAPALRRVRRPAVRTIGIQRLLQTRTARLQHRLPNPAVQTRRRRRRQQRRRQLPHLARHQLRQRRLQLRQRRRFLRLFPLAFLVPINHSPRRHRGPPCPWSCVKPKSRRPAAARQHLPVIANARPPRAGVITYQRSVAHPDPDCMSLQLPHSLRIHRRLTSPRPSSTLPRT